MKDVRHVLFDQSSNDCFEHDQFLADTIWSRSRVLWIWWIYVSGCPLPSTYLQTQNISPFGTGAIFVNTPFPAKVGGGGRERLRNF